jgi:hypothetical protein
MSEVSVSLILSTKGQLMCEDYPCCGHDLNDCPEQSEEDFREEDGDWMDGDALASAGWGTDEDYGGWGDMDW